MASYIVLGLFQAVVILVVGALLRAPDIDMPLKQLLSDRMSLLMVGAFAVTLAASRRRTLLSRFPAAGVW